MSELSVEITHLFISPGHNYYGRHGKGSEDYAIIDADEINLIAGRGVEGDRFYDYKEDYKGQVTLFDHATYERVMEKFELPDLKPSAFRRNVVIKGIDLNSLIGKEFRLQGIGLSGSEEAKPCYWMDEACASGVDAPGVDAPGVDAPGVEDFLLGSGGLRCRITSDGRLEKGTHSLELL
jgi:MOSC domain-containing protein YiiM